VLAAVWLGLLVAAVWLLPRARAGRLGGRDAAAAIAVAVAAVALVGWERRLHATGAVDWSVVGTGWLPALVALCRPAWECLTGGLLVFAAHAVVAYRVFGVTTLGQARLAATGYTVLVILAGFAGLRPAIRPSPRWPPGAPRWPARLRRNGPRRRPSSKTGGTGWPCWKPTCCRCCAASRPARWTRPTARCSSAAPIARPRCAAPCPTGISRAAGCWPGWPRRSTRRRPVACRWKSR
jgi:hypothetical protein